MTDKQKIKELLVGMASSEWCDNAAKRKIQNDILPLIDSLPEKPELTKFETELLSIMADYGVEKASDDDIRREANRLLKIARSIPVEWTKDEKENWNKRLDRIIDVLDYAAEKGRISESDRDDYTIMLKALRPQSKHEWNEEDSRILGNLKSELTNLVARGLIKRETEDKYVSWLDSIKPQNRWKPRKEQIGALDHAINCYAISFPTHKEDIGALMLMKERLKELTD